MLVWKVTIHFIVGLDFAQVIPVWQSTVKLLSHLFELKKVESIGWCLPCSIHSHCRTCREITFQSWRWFRWWISLHWWEWSVSTWSRRSSNYDWTWIRVRMFYWRFSEDQFAFFPGMEQHSLWSMFIVLEWIVINQNDSLINWTSMLHLKNVLDAS